MHLDQRDLDILRILSRDGRITKAALADQVGLSPTPCWERLTMDVEFKATCRQMGRVSSEPGCLWHRRKDEQDG